MSILESSCEFLCCDDPPGPSDLIFVLAGRPEREPYGLELFRQGLAPRLILSVGRFEVRHASALLELPGLLTLRDNLAPEQRHFWIDFQSAQPAQPEMRMARLQTTNTFWELRGLADYLQTAAAVPSRISIVSTSIHLRRVRYCCSRIDFFADKTLTFVAVPEEKSSFRKEAWWRRPGHWSYFTKEYCKLAAYRRLY